MHVEEETVEEEHQEKWVKHYSSNHRILLVGEGDFSFSSSLALSFGSASNIVATSLDPYDVLVKKYKKAKSNLETLLKLGASTLHGVDATKMKFHPDLKMQKFDRIIFNFPHAGFHGTEDNICLIKRHKRLVLGFFENARCMLRAHGETHVTHKTSAPYCKWNIEALARRNFLELIMCVDFKIENYPGYNNKRGDSRRCDADEPFHLGECSTFKFRFSPALKKISEVTSHVDFTHKTYEQSNSFPIGMQYRPTLFHHGHPQTYFSENMNDMIGQEPSHAVFSTRTPSIFGGCFNHTSEIYQRPIISDMGYFANGEQRCNYGRYLVEVEHSRRSQQSRANPIEIQYQPKFGPMDAQRGLKINMNELPGHVEAPLTTIRRESINDLDRNFSDVSTEAWRQTIEGTRMFDYEKSVESVSGRTFYELKLMDDMNIGKERQKLVQLYGR